MAGKKCWERTQLVSRLKRRPMFDSLRSGQHYGESPPKMNLAPWMFTLQLAFLLAGEARALRGSLMASSQLAARR
jgi:hypothetical protein